MITRPSSKITTIDQRAYFAKHLKQQLTDYFHQHYQPSSSQALDTSLSSESTPEQGEENRLSLSKKEGFSDLEPDFNSGSFDEDLSDNDKRQPVRRKRLKKLNETSEKDEEEEISLSHESDSSEFDGSDENLSSNDDPQVFNRKRPRELTRDPESKKRRRIQNDWSPLLTQEAIEAIFLPAWERRQDIKLSEVLSSLGCSDNKVNKRRVSQVKNLVKERNSRIYRKLKIICSSQRIKEFFLKEGPITSKMEDLYEVFNKQYPNVATRKTFKDKGSFIRNLLQISGKIEMEKNGSRETARKDFRDTFVKFYEYASAHAKDSASYEDYVEQVGGADAYSKKQYAENLSIFRKVFPTGRE